MPAHDAPDAPAGQGGPGGTIPRCCGPVRCLSQGTPEPTHRTGLALLLWLIGSEKQPWCIRAANSNADGDLYLGVAPICLATCGSLLPQNGCWKPVGVLL